MRAPTFTLISLSLIASAAAFAACSSSDTPEIGATGGASGGSGQDSSVDAPDSTSDAKSDTTSDAASDAPDSGKTDAAIDSSADGAAGSSQDAAVVDTAPEAEPDVNFAYDAPVYDAAVEACATSSVEATLKPLDLYFMVDRSGSMAGTPWTNQSNALKSFFSDAKSAGLTAALRFFPINNSSTGATCNGSTYTTPLVGWGTLVGNATGHALTLTQAINATQPQGDFTPTQDALYGVLKGAKARQLAQPGHVVAAVIVSDGSPNTCQDNSATGMGAIANSFYQDTPAIRTFSIYVANAATAVMTQIAQQGGTGQSYNATAGTQAFFDALKAIQGSAIPCDFPMPTSGQGIVDPDEVKLVYNANPVPRVANAGACAGDGWYYDVPAAPTKIIMCPDTCTKMKADPNAKMKVELGCLGS